VSDDNVQNYGNHVRWLPPWHFVVFPVLLINALLALKTLIQAPSGATAWAAAVALAIPAGIFFSRWMPLRVQDRVIRLEEMLRLERLLPGRYSDFERLSPDQLVALRFASDAEVPHIVDRILSGEIRTRDEIKVAVQHWRPDHSRI
jgi:hypothetical protein